MRRVLTGNLGTLRPRMHLSRVQGLMRERVGAKLEMYDLASGSFAAFRVKRSSSAVSSPQAFSLPTSVLIVDSAVHSFRVKSHGIRDPKHNKLPAVGQQRKQRVIPIAGGDRHILAEPKRVELIHPAVVASLGAPWVGDALQLGPW